MPVHILLTSGPTRAPLDAIRFLTNRSTGRFGTLVATSALRRGARVAMIAGAGSEVPPPHRRLRVVRVETNADLARALRAHLRARRVDAVIHAMAVLDFQPTTVRREKVASRGAAWIIRLERAPKIIQRIKRWAPRTLLIAFKLESRGGRNRLLARARRLLAESGADVVAANQLAEGDDRQHRSYLVDADGRVSRTVTGKRALARAVVDIAMRIVPPRPP
jgi:phosphopantothenoylcysteine synthetase/decarboxylase